MNFTSCTPILLISSHPYIHTYFPLAAFPQQRKKMSSWKCSMYSVSHSVPFVHTSFFTSVHCNDSLVWYEASGFCCTVYTGISVGLGFCYTVYTGISVGLLLHILLLPWVMEILWSWIYSIPSCSLAVH
jgi:hypothetical protein